MPSMPKPSGHPLAKVLTSFYEWLELEGLIEEQVRHSPLIRNTSVSKFLEAHENIDWGIYQAPLPGMLPQEPGPNFGEDPYDPADDKPAAPDSDPKQLLERALYHQDEYERIHALENQAKHPSPMMHHALMAENLSLLSIASTLIQIQYEEDDD